MRGRHRRAKRFLFHAAVRVCCALANGIPRSAAFVIFARIGDVVRWIDRPAVRRARAHLAIAQGAIGDETRREGIVRDLFPDLARNLVDALRLPYLTPAEIRELVAFDGEEHLATALARGRGAVVISAHLGNWELLGAALAARGHRMHVIARRLFDARSDRILNRWRSNAGIVVHDSEDGLRPIVRALRAGEIVGGLVDQDTGGPSIFAEFFGRPARTSIALFELARRLEVPIVPMTIRLDGKTHRVRVHPSIPPPASSDREGRLRQDVLAWHAILERAIVESPTQWVWFHRRWKSTPPLATPPPEPRSAETAARPGFAVPSSRRVAISR